MDERVLVRRYDSVDGFRAAAEPYLLLHEAEHCLMLGILSGLEAGEWGDTFLATADGAGGTSLVAMRTPPHRLIVSQVRDGAGLATVVGALADALGGAEAVAPTGDAPAAPTGDATAAPTGDATAAKTGPGVNPVVGSVVDEVDRALPGVLGDVRVAEAFAERWCGHHARSWRTAMAERIYRCDHVEPVPAVEGRMRPITEDDRGLLRAWITAFVEESLPGEPFDADELVERVLASPLRRMWLWDVGGEPVAMTAAVGPTPNGIRISYVYTPVAKRRRGYATALVAGVTRAMLDEGRRFCFLFTDLANPTSNAVYQRIGYRPVSDVAAIDFVPTPA
jgi:predicted GNAT family acetyltransferase